MNSCKYTWIVILIPLATCKMKSISTIITIRLNIIHDYVKLMKYSYIYIIMYTKYNYMYMCESILTLSIS